MPVTLTFLTGTHPPLPNVCEVAPHADSGGISPSLNTYCTLAEAAAKGLPETKLIPTAAYFKEVTSRKQIGRWRAVGKE
jgi:hypothetical protein